MFRPGVAAIAAASSLVLLSPESHRAAAWFQSQDPAGLQVISDQPWATVTTEEWSYLRRSSPVDSDVVEDPTAPQSPARVLRIPFAPAMARDSEPGVHWVGLPQLEAVHVQWWMKLSSNWTASPAGAGKIAFLWAPDGEGQAYSNIGGSRAPHRINVNTEWAPYGQKFWEPNVASTPVRYGQWYRIDWEMRWETRPGAGDGTLRWWVDGTLNGSYGNVRYPGCCFQQFDFAPTRQLPPPEMQHMYIDHTRVSVPPRGPR